uniref:Secreted protein n=1 Tax=Steinernema glaseri TaxID=37863 RepID=A0A1I7YBK1_9BILA
MVLADSGAVLIRSGRTVKVTFLSIKLLSLTGQFTLGPIRVCRFDRANWLSGGHSSVVKVVKRDYLPKPLRTYGNPSDYPFAWLITCSRNKTSQRILAMMEGGSQFSIQDTVCAS